jgi:transcription elongation GreA/GreB family factor
VAELEAAIGDVTALALRTFAAKSPIALSALVTVEEDGGEHRFWLAPAGGGSVLAGEIQVVTPNSPLGQAFLGKRLDDEVELRLPGKLRSFVVTAIE